tara:strand:+ start:217 stop:360 length:144 start_codon:yes stop_codon:yes gene_type:complete
MIDNSSSKNIENEEFNLENQESDFKKLITRLIEIKETISLLEKTMFR